MANGECQASPCGPLTRQEKAALEHKQQHSVVLQKELF